MNQCIHSESHVPEARELLVCLRCRFCGGFRGGSWPIISRGNKAGSKWSAVPVATPWVSNVIKGAINATTHLARGTQCPLVAIAVGGQNEDKRRAREAGFVHHVVKSVESADIVVDLKKLHGDRLS